MNEKLTSIKNIYPQYSNIFDTVNNWLIAHPDNKVSSNVFRSEKYGFDVVDIQVAFYIMKQSEFLYVSWEYINGFELPVYGFKP